jgi:hypothetical protein
MTKHDSSTSDKSLDWVLFNRGGWGDVFIDYAYICQFKDKFNVLFYGYDKYIPEFLKLQDNIEEVVHVVPESHTTYYNAVAYCNGTDRTWLEEIRDQTNPKIKGEIFAISGYDRLEKIIRKIDLTFPEKEFKVEKPSLLFNPYSFQSVRFHDHCPLIPEILSWLVSESKWNIIMTGQKTFYNAASGEQPFPLNIEDDHPNLQNLVGETESMLDVFHIASQCKGVVTTSNCLSHWSIMVNKPTLVLMNEHCTNADKRKVTKFHRDWVEYEPNTMLNYDCTPNQFMETFEKWEKTL